jgi:hypothetical protein
MSSYSEIPRAVPTREHSFLRISYAFSTVEIFCTYPNCVEDSKFQRVGELIEHEFQTRADEFKRVL